MSSSTFEDNGREYLEHYGVKGMRWGVRRSEAERAAARKGRQEKKAAKKADRKARNQGIKDARSRQQKRYEEWNEAEKDFYKSLFTGGRKEAYRNLEDKATNYNYNKDAYTAQKMTTGEKWAAGAFTAGIAAVYGAAVWAAEKSY